MTESKTFVCEGHPNRQITYEVHEKGLTYRVHDNQPRRFNWAEIEYIEDCPGERIDIFVKNQPRVPVRYITNDFSCLLKTVCMRLAEIHSQKADSHHFTLTSNYWLHLNFVMAVLLAALTGSFFMGLTPFILLLILIAPVGFFLLRQATSLSLSNHCITLKDSLKQKRVIAYDEIQSIDFAVKRNDYGNTLSILIKPKNRPVMTLKKFENVILIFILIQAFINKSEP